MRSIHNLIRPYTLESGWKYLWADRTKFNPRPLFLPVTFIAYTSCPAMVIVGAADGKKWRCRRDEIFALKNEIESGGGVEFRVAV